MKKMNNRVNLQGYIYENKLELKTSGPQSKNPGTQFINGTLDIATDDAMTNVISVHFTYVTPTYSASGKTNRTFTVLSDIINGRLKTVMTDGKDVASKVSVSGSVEVNDFYTNRNGAEELVSAKRIEGSFVTVLSALSDKANERNQFDVDIVINGVRRIEADEERNLPEKLVIKGCVFDFRNAMKPVEFSVVNPRAIDYFEGLEPAENNPIFTRVRGAQISETVVTHVEEANAFGEPYVREVSRSRRDWVVTWAPEDPYLWDDESTITGEEMNKCITDRNIYLAGVKQRHDEYVASQNGVSTTSTSTSNNDYNF